jgi:hypothetical protein
LNGREQVNGSKHRKAGRLSDGEVVNSELESDEDLKEVAKQMRKTLNQQFDEDSVGQTSSARQASFRQPRATAGRGGSDLPDETDVDDKAGLRGGGFAISNMLFGLNKIDRDTQDKMLELPRGGTSDVCGSQSSIKSSSSASPESYSSTTMALVQMTTTREARKR